PAAPRRPRAAAARPATAGRAQRRAAAEVLAVPGPVLLDLVAEVIGGGAPLTRAVAAVGEALAAVDDHQAAGMFRLAEQLASPVTADEVVGRPTRRFGASPRRASPRRGLGRVTRQASDPPPAIGRLAEALDLAIATGAGPVGLIRAVAQAERHARVSRGVHQARRLGVLVLLPTGLCLLPAFLLLTVVPLAIGLAAG
ncbi:MAG TPA: hypothetical protein VI248_22295, partial [Kineosporiaceae bacterium]